MKPDGATHDHRQSFAEMAQAMDLYRRSLNEAVADIGNEFISWQKEMWPSTGYVALSLRIDRRKGAAGDLTYAKWQIRHMYGGKQTFISIKKGKGPRYNIHRLKSLNECPESYRAKVDETETALGFLRERQAMVRKMFGTAQCADTTYNKESKAKAASRLALPK